MGPLVASSSFVKTISLLHIADTFPPNLPSANDSMDTLNRDLQGQKNHRRIMLVPTPQPGDRFISSPLGLIAKGGQTNTWRRIHHLSFPRGRSVNDHIPPDWGTLEYTSLDEAVAMTTGYWASPGTTNTGRTASSHSAFAHHPLTLTSSLKSCIPFSKQLQTSSETFR